jgi:hypothetical protein
VTNVQPYPAAEALVIEVLSSVYDGLGYAISPVIPDTLPTVTVTVQGITGKPVNIRLDNPVLVLSAITSKHISGDSGYGIGDQLCHRFWADLYNQRGVQWSSGVITDVRTISSPHRVVDVNVDTFRFETTLQLAVHS